MQQMQSLRKCVLIFFLFLIALASVSSYSRFNDVWVRGWLNVSNETAYFDNASANNFLGKFHWHIFPGDSERYLGFNKSHLLFNESELNQTVEEIIAVTYFNATSINVNVGTDNTNDISYIQNHDGLTYNISEAAGAPAMDVRINFTGVTDFNQLVIRMKTTDGGKHRYAIQIWDYDEAIWEDYTNFVEVDIFKVMDLGVYDSDQHISSGLVQVRIYLEDSGIPSHEVFLDWIVLSDGAATFSTNEIDPLSFHKGDNIDNSGYNISGSISASNVDRDIPSNCSSGYAVIGWDDNLSTTFCKDSWLNSDGDTGSGNYTFDSPTFHVDSTGNKVGIGTPTPYFPLHINSGTVNTGLLVQSTDANANICLQDSGSTANDYVRISAQGDDLLLYANHAEVMRLQTGNVGIGTTSPSDRLVVRSSGNINDESLVIWERLDGAIQGTLGLHKDTGNNVYVGSITNHPLNLQTNNVTQVTVLANGNVGIGVDPLARLDVQGTGTIARFRDASATGSPRIGLYQATNERMFMEYENGVGGKVDCDASIYVYPGNAFSTSFRSDGKVGIGITSPLRNLHIVDSEQAQLLIRTDSASVGDNASLLFKVTTDDTDAYIKGGIFFERTGTYGIGKLHLANDIGEDNGNVQISDAKLTISNNGNVGIGELAPDSILEVKGDVHITNTTTGSNTGTDLCIDANGRICACGSCA